MMSFMQQQIESGQWLAVETRDGLWYLPYDVCPSSVDMFLDAVEDGQYDEDELSATGKCDLLEYLPVFDANHVYSVSRVSGYGARLSAPGYMDCTDWCVFDTEDEARAYLRDTYGDE